MATLPDVGGELLSYWHTYRFILDPPIIDTPYFAELYANALLASFSGSDYLGCFNADLNRRLLMLEMGMPIPCLDEPSTEFTKCTFYVSGGMFLS